MSKWNTSFCTEKIDPFIKIPAMGGCTASAFVVGLSHVESIHRAHNGTILLLFEEKSFQIDAVLDFPQTLNSCEH